MIRLELCATLALALSVVGCSSIPAGAPPRRMTEAGSEPMPLRLAIGTPSVRLADDEKAKQWRVEEGLPPRELGESIVQWVSASPVVSSVRLAAGNGDAALAEAWNRKDDLLLDIDIVDVRASFDGHNGWWIPNIVNWCLWVIPAWWVATEEYTLSFTANLTVRSVDSARELHRDVVKVDVSGTFDEFDRGWQFFGFISPSNEAENWQLVASALRPAAQEQLGAGIVKVMGGALRQRLASLAVTEEMRKTLALVIGVSHYQEQVQFPPAPFVAEDALAVMGALSDKAGCALPAHQVTTVLGTEATRARVLEAVQQVSARMRAGDQLLIYFAGYGTRQANGAPALLLHDATMASDGAGVMTLAELGQVLKAVPGEKLLLLDCSFDGRGRSAKTCSAAAPADPAADARGLSEAADAAVVMGTSAGGELLVPEHLGAGLFTHHLVRGVRGEADLDHDGRLTPGELSAFLSDRTTADSAYFGMQQRPSTAGLDRGIALPVGTATTTNTPK